MNRLQKKCLVASGGVHLLLALILFVGPGFISSRSKQDDLPILDFVPMKTVDELMSGGGNPNAKPPPAAAPVQPPPQPQPQPQPAMTPPPPKPQPEKVREPDPPKETQPVKREEDSLEPAKERKKIQVNTTLVTRKDPNADKKAHEEAQAREEAKAQADARRRLARQIGRAAERIGNEVSSSTDVELKGPGGGGLPYANFIQAVKSVYDKAWVLPDGVENENAITVASVTIARDGTVISHRIIDFSGDRVMDRAVQVTLDRVTYAAPLPDGSKEDQRTVSITFSFKAKQLTG